jgi:hypothetical protein
MTKLPKGMQKMYDRHRLGMTKAVEFLEDLGIVIYHQTHILEDTKLNIHIRHDNDYVEMGPLENDPEGEMFHVYTAQNVEFSVPCEKLSSVMQAIKEHRSIGQKRIADNVRIETDVCNQFTMQRHIFANDYNWEKVEIRLEFRVYHEFK